MTNINSVTITGRLTASPQVNNGVANMSLVFSTYDKNAEKNERANFVKIKAFGKLAETCGTYLTKGAPVAIAGKLHHEQWTTKEGAKRSDVVIYIEQMQMLGDGKKKSDGYGNAGTESPHTQSRYDDDDVPF